MHKIIMNDKQDISAEKVDNDYFLWFWPKIVLSVTNGGNMIKNILLIAFYNQKALGVKYISESLKRFGYVPHVLFFKEYNSKKPSEVSDSELNLLRDLIDQIHPDYIALSVMSSLYLQEIIKVNSYIKTVSTCPVIWGGVYCTLFPEKCLEYADYVIRGEGEEAIVELIERLSENKDPSDIQNLAYKKDKTCYVNPVRPLIQDLDRLGYPGIGQDNVYFISNDKLIERDPILSSLTYETTASRGCPFSCSYCSSVNLKRTYRGKGNFVRFRSVDSIIQELVEAKNKLKRLKLIHFWDEIFSDEADWIDEFKVRYKKEVGIPFTIWGHPLRVSENVIKGLVDAGLYHIVVGIQSGSVRVRKEIFHRAETQEQIINASRIISKCRVPVVSYDFILQHPFETLKDLKDTFELCLMLDTPFELNLHGLYFLPGTDIVDIAVSKGLFSYDEIEKIMYGSMQEQYDIYWGTNSRKESETELWSALIFLTQFHSLRPLLKKIAASLEGRTNNKREAVLLLRKIYSNIANARKLWNKAKLLIS